MMMMMIIILILVTRAIARIIVNDPFVSRSNTRIASGRGPPKHLQYRFCAGNARMLIPNHTPRFSLNYQPDLRVLAGSQRRTQSAQHCRSSKGLRRSSPQWTVLLHTAGLGLLESRAHGALPRSTYGSGNLFESAG